MAVIHKTKKADRTKAVQQIKPLFTSVNLGYTTVDLLPTCLCVITEANKEANMIARIPCTFC